MRARCAIAWSLVAPLVALAGCTRANPAFDLDGGLDQAQAEDDDPEAEPGEGRDDPESSTAGSEEWEELTSGPGSAGDEDDSGDASETGDELPNHDQDDPPLFYASFDSLDSVTSPEIGAGEGQLSDPAPYEISAPQDQGLRFVSSQQWFAFPQHDGQVANVDHAAGSLSFSVRVEFSAPHVSPRDLVSLAGVVADGGGVRLGVAGVLDGNRLWVQYVDGWSQSYITRYPAGLLPADTWAEVELVWNTDVEPDEPNIELWIDGEWIEPLDGYARGPKQAGPASPEDVMIFGSWSLGSGYAAEASFDEIELRGG